MIASADDRGLMVQPFGIGQEVLQQLQSFFGTLAGQSDRTLQDVADEEDLDVDEEVAHGGPKNWVKLLAYFSLVPCSFSHLQSQPHVSVHF